MTRFITVLFTLLFSVSAFSQKKEINWMTFEEVEEAMKEEPRKVVVDVYTTWCGPCKMMMKQTYGDDEVIDYINEHYYAVKFDAESPDPVTFQNQTFENPGYDPNKRGRNSTHQLTGAIASKQGRIAYPTTTFLSKELQGLTLIQGFLRPPQFLPILVFFAEDYHTKMSHEEFMENVYNAE